MNAARRKQITAILAKVADIMPEIEQLHQEEEEAYEAMPDSLKESDKGERAAEKVENLRSAFEFIEQIETELQSAIEP